MRSFVDNNRRLIFVRKAATIFLVVLISWQASGLTWKILGSGHGIDALVSNQSRSAGGDTGSRKRELEKKAPVAEIPIFGVGERSVEVKRPSRKDEAPLTSLALLLKGVVMMEPVNRAMAIIAEKGKPDQEKLYSVGDTVPGNAVVDEILFDRVILRRGGAAETLLLLGNETQAVPNERKSGEIKSQGDGINWQIDRVYWNRKLADIPGLAREIGVEIYKENNVQKGYKLLSARGSKLLRDLGLQPGDVLYEVNGVPLNSIQDGLAVYKQMNNATEVRVIFGRDGKREARVYKIGN